MIGRDHFKQDAYGESGGGGRHHTGGSAERDGFPALLQVKRPNNIIQPIETVLEATSSSTGLGHAV